MKNASIIEIIKDKFAEQQMSAEYHLQLTNVVELEDKFTKDFDKEKWKEYFNLDLAKGALFNIETDQLLDFAIELLKELKF